MSCWSWRPLSVFQTFRFNECGMILAITFPFQNITHISNCFGQLLIWYICKDRSPQPSRKTVWICPPSTLPRQSIEFPEASDPLFVCRQLCVCPAFRTISKLQSFEKKSWRSLILLFKRKVLYSHKSFFLDIHIYSSQTTWWFRIPNQSSPIRNPHVVFLKSSGQVRQIDGLSSASIVMRKTLEELELNLEGAVGGKVWSWLGCNKSAKPTVLLMEDIGLTNWYGKYHRFF